MAAKILIVEDEKDQSKPFLELLTFKGYDVTVAENGLDAIAATIRLRPDLLIVDLLLVRRGDELDGYGVIREVRATKVIERTGILAWTSHFVKETDHIRALRIGADDFVTKDVEFGVLEARIEALLRRVRWSLE